MSTFLNHAQRAQTTRRQQILPLQAGAYVHVVRCSSKRARRDGGFVGRSGEVVRVHYAPQETKVYVRLDSNLACGSSREWLHLEEIEVTHGAAEASAP